MPLDVYALTGSKLTQSITLPEAVFNVEVSPALLAQAVRVYLSNQRQGTKSVKTRGEVSYSTRKIWRQKGTGRARHGSKKAPIFVGGGVAHGPTGNENYTLKFPIKMRRLALLGALTSQAKASAIRVVDDFSASDGKSKSLLPLLTAVSDYPKHTTLFILDAPCPLLVRSLKNLPKVLATQVSRINAYEVMQAKTLIISSGALEKLKLRLKV